MLPTAALFAVASTAACRRAPARPCARAVSQLVQRPLSATSAAPSPGSPAAQFFFRRQTRPVGAAPNRQRRGAATAAEEPAKPQGRGGRRRPLLALALLGIGAGTGYFLFSPADSASTAPPGKEHPAATAKKAPKEVDYFAVYKAIAELLEDDNYDDGSYGPVFVRLAWYACLSERCLDGTGGSNGATMRFAPESEHGANAGLSVARQRLEQVKKKFPEISYGDLWTLAGVCAIQEVSQIDWIRVVTTPPSLFPLPLTLHWCDQHG
ncbi:MAG: heme peroxidase [Olpidium bornovanus]|uniref:Peroxidase n=1 Tax=Olpidium bornovanus TaxID=278681 RepID=A0A8H8DLV0_9FUNG|nr:MAG: heme peroxidase [Olpidium bornovanus]